MGGIPLTSVLSLQGRGGIFRAIEEINELGLTPIPKGKIEVLTATGVVEQDAFLALGEIQGRGFAAMATANPIPVIGYEILENLKFRVKPVTGTLERLPPGTLGPPYRL